MTSLMIDNPKENRILAALSVEEYARLLPMLEFVKTELGQILYGSGDRQGYVYFPTTCIVSLVFTTENGSSAELAIIGNDGLVGVPIILGGVSTTHQATVQSAGNAYRLKSELVCHEFDRGAGLQSLALRYTQALMAQMAQSVVCNRHHSVDKQLCRWLLLSLDRLPGNQVRMTHELIANMLGVRREGVTEAAGKLQLAGLIRYSRGLITVIDRPALEARVCECYAVIKKELDRLFHLPMESRPSEYQRPAQASLREQAEQRLQENKPERPANATDEAGLLHELQVHQIELEMQLQALHTACSEADTLRERYADIYDFAPVGYFSLNADACILELNLAAAILLGIKRSDKSQHRFNAFVAPEYLTEFNRFLRDVLHAQNKKACEIALLPTAQRDSAIVRIEAVPDEEGNECRMVVVDITAQDQAEKLLLEREHYLQTLLDNLPAMVWQEGDALNPLKLSMLNSIPTAIAVIDRDGVILVINDHWRRFSLENSLDQKAPAARTDIGSNYLSVCQAGQEADSPGAAEAFEGISAVLNGTKSVFSLEYLCATSNQEHCFQMQVTPLGQYSIEGAVITHSDVTERKRLESLLRQQAMHDAVTQLPNRLLLKDRLSQAMKTNKRNDSHGALIYLGLDHAGLHDGQRGAAASDALMKQIAQRLQAAVRAMDTVARIDDNEFVVMVGKLVADVSESSFEAGYIAEKICKSFSQPFYLPLNGEKCDTFAHTCSISAGVSLFAKEESQPDEILQSSRRAMLSAREAGGNLVRFHLDNREVILSAGNFQDIKPDPAPAAKH